MNKVRCTKCGIREANPQYTVDRDTAFCAECASLLRLGTSREALKMEQGIPHNAIVEDQEEEVDETL
jgi:hypothetical protein